MKLASIETIKSVVNHPNADSLDIASVLGYQVIVKRGQYKDGDLCVFIQPDTVLPDAPWTAFYKAKSNRVRAIKLRGAFSEGIVERLETVGLPLESEGEVSSILNITKYEPPLPQDLSAKGPLPYGIPPTDEERVNNLIAVPWGEKVDVTLKIDGQSWSAYKTKRVDGEVVTGICGRRLELKTDCVNNYTRNDVNHEVRLKIASINDSICLRGEQYGTGIQSSANNPHSKLPLGLAFFSVWLIDERRYACKGEKYYAYDFIPTLGLPVAPVI